MSNLSDKLRPGVEAAPWVIEEVKRLETKLERALARAEKAEAVANDAYITMLRDRERKAEAERDAALARAEKAEADALLAAGLEDRYWQQAKKAEAERDAALAKLERALRPKVTLRVLMEVFGSHADIPPALLTTSWKDGIDIDEPSRKAQKLVDAALKGTT